MTEIFSKHYALYNDRQVWIMGTDTKKRMWVYHLGDQVVFPIDVKEQAKINYFTFTEQKNTVRFYPHLAKIRLGKKEIEFSLPVINNISCIDVIMQQLTEALSYVYKKIEVITEVPLAMSPLSQMKVKHHEEAVRKEFARIFKTPSVSLAKKIIEEETIRVRNEYNKISKVTVPQEVQKPTILSKIVNFFKRITRNG